MDTCFSFILFWFGATDVYGPKPPKNTGLRDQFLDSYVSLCNNGEFKI